MKMLATNTLAPFRLIQAALPHLRQTRGCVLNIGSMNAYCGEPDLLPHSVSKGALMTMTRNLGDPLMREDGVRVNQINPGWTLTEAEQKRKLEEGLGDECGPISGQVVDLEQHPFIGRNPPKDKTTIPT